MKLTATACLVVAAALYLLSLQLEGTAAGYLAAGSEAAMVGGLADWFAVTALFRRPLGLPLPHTALVPKQKDELALRLGEYVTSEFVTPHAVVALLEENDVVERMAAYLADEGHATTLAREVTANLAAVLEHVEDDDVVAYVEALLRRDLARRSYAPVLGRLLERGVAGQVQRPLIDLVAGRTHRYLRANREELIPQAREFIEGQSWLAFLVSDKRIRRVLDGVADTMADVEKNPQHPLRAWVNGLLASVAEGLQRDAVTGAELHRLLTQLMDDPQAQAALRELVVDSLESVRLSLLEDDEVLRARVASVVATLGRRLLTEDVLRERVRTTVAGVASHLVEQYGDKLTELIHSQVVARDAATMSRRIELEVGRDLQYIRLNGTAVGALAGLAIHAVTVAVT